jgi:hypothetical protein
VNALEIEAVLDVCLGGELVDVELEQLRARVREAQTAEERTWARLEVQRIERRRK